MGGRPRNLSTLLSAFADQVASLTHAAPYREPRKYEARYQGNDNAGKRISHRSQTTLQADYPPVPRIVWQVTIVCQSDATRRNCIIATLQTSSTSSMVSRSCLKWPFCCGQTWGPGPIGSPHIVHRGRPAATTAAGFGAQVPRLLARHAAGERGVALLLAVEIVGDDDDAVLVVVVAQLHATDPKLLPRLPVELGQTRRGRKHGASVGQAREHLLQRQSQRMDLLLLHPDRVCLPVDDRQEPETAVAWFPDRFDQDPLRVEISTHSFESPGFGGKTRSAPDTWNWRSIARGAFSNSWLRTVDDAVAGCAALKAQGSPYTLREESNSHSSGQCRMAETSKIAVPSSRRPVTRAGQRDEDGDPFHVSSDGQAGTKASVTLDTVKADPEVQAFIRNANRNLGVIGYTEHGFRHVGLVANIARNILKRMGFDRRQQDLAAISGYLHDIGNVVSRLDHARTGALARARNPEQTRRDAGGHSDRHGRHRLSRR